WTALDGADRLLDGGLSGAATAGGSDAGRCAGPGNQFGEHAESLGGSQPGGRAALSAIAGAVAARSSAERGRDGLAQQRRQALDVDSRGQAVRFLCGGVHGECRSACGAAEAGYCGDCRGCAESFGAAIWPGRVGRGGPAVSSLVSVSRRPAGSAGESAADQSASAPSESDALAEEAVRLGRDALGPRQQRSAESGHRALCSLRAIVYLSRSERRRAYQQWGGTGAADGGAMAQDLFRQSPSQWRNRHGPLTHGHPNLQAAAASRASRAGLSQGSGTMPSSPDCLTLSAPTADLTPELLRSNSMEITSLTDHVK